MCTVFLANYILSTVFLNCIGDVARADVIKWRASESNPHEMTKFPLFQRCQVEQTMLQIPKTLQIALEIQPKLVRVVVSNISNNGSVTPLSDMVEIVKYHEQERSTHSLWCP